jgi:hypothetical protein
LRSRVVKVKEERTPACKILGAVRMAPSSAERTVLKYEIGIRKIRSLERRLNHSFVMPHSSLI